MLRRAYSSPASLPTNRLRRKGRRSRGRRTWSEPALEWERNGNGGSAPKGSSWVRIHRTARDRLKGSTSMRRLELVGVAARATSDRLGKLTARLVAVGVAAMLIGVLSGGDLVAAASQPGASAGTSSRAAATTSEAKSPSVTTGSSATTATGATLSPNQAASASGPISGCPASRILDTFGLE